MPKKDEMNEVMYNVKNSMAFSPPSHLFILQVGGRSDYPFLDPKRDHLHERSGTTRRRLVCHSSSGKKINDETLMAGREGESDECRETDEPSAFLLMVQSGNIMAYLIIIGYFP